MPAVVVLQYFRFLTKKGKMNLGTFRCDLAYNIAYISSLYMHLCSSPAQKKSKAQPVRKSLRLQNIAAVEAISTKVIVDTADDQFKVPVWWFCHISLHSCGLIPCFYWCIYFICWWCFARKYFFNKWFTFFDHVEECSGSQWCEL